MALNGGHEKDIKYNFEKYLLVSEKSSLLRSSVTTDEVRYDYSSTPSHNLEGVIPATYKEFEWQNKFGKHVEKIKHIELEFEKDVERIDLGHGHEMEHDSGIESNDSQDSHCELFLSQVMNG